MERFRAGPSCRAQFYLNTAQMLCAKCSLTRMGVGRHDCQFISDWTGTHLFARDRDRLATVLAAAMRTSAPVSADSAQPAWEGTRLRGVSPTAAGSSARMCSMVCRGSPASLWSSSYMTVVKAGISRYFALSLRSPLCPSVIFRAMPFLPAGVTGTKLQSHISTGEGNNASIIAHAHAKENFPLQCYKRLPRLG